MNIWFALGICIILQIGLSSGLRCWKCDNARSPRDCTRKGYSQQCRFTETVCQTEVRYSLGWGKRPMIKTSCKEQHACYDNFVQNPRGAWGPTQCNGGRFNSVCRCCCNEEHCNKRERDLLCESRDVLPTVQPVTITPRRDVPIGPSFPGEPTSCRTLPKVPNRGKVECDKGRLLTSTCTFTCDEGYERIGSRVAVCWQFPSTPMWNRRSPRCRKLVEKCEPVLEPVNGQASCKPFGRDVGTVCTFACNNGLVLKGASKTTCVKATRTPQWDRRTPACIGVCELISPPTNGRMICVGSREVGKANCSFICNNGFELAGSQSISCIDTTKGPQWSHDPPTCPGICEEVERPANGDVQCTRSNKLGSRCGFVCNRGFTLRGASEATCVMRGNTAKWSEHVPACVGLCEPMASPENGRVDCMGSEEVGKASCRFSCNDGFQLQGAQAASCIDTKNGPQWSRDPPTCSGICKEVGRPANGGAGCSDSNKLGSTCVFYCDPGYTLSEISETTCVIRGNSTIWSENIPTCIGFCEPMPAPVNGRVNCVGSEEVGRANCSFICDDGFQLIGSQSTSCMNTAQGPQWSHNPPTCSGVCEDIGRLLNGRVECTGSNNLGSKCGFFCNAGYKLRGASDTTCVMRDDTPMWSENVPTCIGVCEPMSAPENGSVDCIGSQEVGRANCRFSCNDGFQLIGSQSTSCMAAIRGPQWSHDPPVCSGICEEIVRPENGQVECTSSNNLGSRCEFFCNTDFTLRGASETTCVLRGGTTMWSENVPTCIGVCQPISAPENGRVDCVGSEEVDIASCRFTCNDGFQLVGSQSTSCVDTTIGPQWNTDPPTCSGVCEEVGRLENGIVQCTRSNTLGSICGFVCNRGFALSGARNTTCVSGDNRPNWSKNVPTCVGLCEPMSPPDNGKVECVGSEVVGNGTCRFSCNDGFQLVGFQITFCTDTTTGPQWSNSTPTCSGVCENVGRPINGNVECTRSNNLGSQCGFFCNNGFTLSGASETACVPGEQGPAWSEDVPTCDGVCEQIERPENGVVQCTRSNNLGSRCRFTCNNGLTLTGASESTCVVGDAGPEWSERVPTCNGSCGDVSAPENGYVVCTGSGRLGDECNFFCNQSRILEGAASTSCELTLDGPRWTTGPPTCVGVCLAPVESPENGDLDCTGSGRVGETNCVFRCNFGLVIEGSETTSCIEGTEGPRWSHEVPKCQGSCDSIAPPENGAVNCTGSGELGTTCTFSCNTGLQLEGADKSTCTLTQDGVTWSDNTPKCIGSCETLPVFANGLVECIGSGELGTRCEFVCDQGMEMKGDTVISCVLTQEGPRWTAVSPTCSAPIPNCPALGALPNGQITCSNEENSVGTRCSFECTTEGYSLLPSTRLQTECEATSDGTSSWTNLKPCCNAQCPPVAKRDIVFVIDSSSSISLREWREMKAFLSDVVETFEISKDAVRIAAFRFFRRVDTATQILFNSYSTKSELKEAINKMPKRGGGTNIGNALRHAQRNVLTVGNREEVPDLVFVLTDGRSSDGFENTAKQLRDSGVEIVALGIFKGKKAQILPQLIEMTGHRDRVLEVQNVLGEAKSDLVNLIVNKVCEVSCE